MNRLSHRVSCLVVGLFLAMAFAFFSKNGEQKKDLSLPEREYSSTGISEIEKVGPARQGLSQGVLDSLSKKSRVIDYVAIVYKESGVDGIVKLVNESRSKSEKQEIVRSFLELKNYIFYGDVKKLLELFVDQELVAYGLRRLFEKSRDKSLLDVIGYVAENLEQIGDKRIMNQYLDELFRLDSSLAWQEAIYMSQEKGVGQFTSVIARNANQLPLENLMEAPAVLGMDSDAEDIYYEIILRHICRDSPEKAEYILPFINDIEVRMRLSEMIVRAKRLFKN